MTNQLMRKALMVALTASLALALSACEERDPAGVGDGSIDLGDDINVAQGPCPAALPGAGACASEGLTCQYGSDPRRNCRPKATCTSGAWQITTPKCTGLPPASCPASLALAAGKLCSTMDAYCSYPGDLACRCTNCTDSPASHCQGDPTWRCDVPNTDQACPPGKPNLGTPCTNEDKRCNYHCGGDGARVCKGKIWTQAMSSPCPISTRRAKHKISYLSPQQADAIARRLLEVKLATYLYKDPALGRGRQLGFILEDVGPSFAGDPTRGQVNLYGYTSMLLATVQAQQRAIRQLQREMRSLRSGRLPRRCAR